MRQQKEILPRIDTIRCHESFALRLIVRSSKMGQFWSLRYFTVHGLEADNWRRPGRVRSGEGGGRGRGNGSRRHPGGDSDLANFQGLLKGGAVEDRGGQGPTVPVVRSQPRGQLSQSGLSLNEFCFEGSLNLFLGFFSHVFPRRIVGKGCWHGVSRASSVRGRVAELTRIGCRKFRTRHEELLFVVAAVAVVIIVGVFQVELLQPLLRQRYRRRRWWRRRRRWQTRNCRRQTRRNRLGFVSNDFYDVRGLDRRRISTSSVARFFDRNFLLLVFVFRFRFRQLGMR